MSGTFSSFYCPFGGGDLDVVFVLSVVVGVVFGEFATWVV